MLIGVLLMSVAISDYAQELFGVKDDPRIVIDEFVGFWFAMAFLPHAWPVIIAAFILFRVFDVFKLPWIRRLQNLPGGWGVVMDDVAAGILTNLLLRMGLTLQRVFM